MLIKTILNKCNKFKSFVYGPVRFVKYEGEDVIEVDIFPRANAKAICSLCHQKAPLYDKLQKRRFEFIPIWGFRVFFIYQMRRVRCELCGVKVEKIPWGIGKKELTKTYMSFLAYWAKKISWKEVAESFQTSWEKVFHAVEYVVNWD